MISFHNIKTIFKKEFLQIMRDKSVLFTNFFIPLFGLPLYLMFIIEASTYMVAKENAPLKDSTIFTVSYQGDLDNNLIKKLDTDDKIKLSKLNISLTENEIKDYRTKFKHYLEIKNKSKKLKDQLKEDKEVLKKNNTILALAKTSYLSALHKLKEKYRSETDLHIAVFKNEENIYVTYFFHSEEIIVSNAALQYVKKLFQNYGDELVKQFKKENKIKRNNLEPFYFWDINLDKTSSPLLKMIGLGMGGGILFLLLISIFNPTINTTIGERDQNTFKVLRGFKILCV